MTNFIGIFPLKVVIYPGETLNLHVFEPRYKQLITECIEGSKCFGIVPVVDDKMGELGTRIEVLELVKTYDNGEMDVRTRGVNVFRILELLEEVPDKLYKGAIVNYPENETTPDNTNISRLIVSEVRRLYDLLNVPEKFPSGKEEMLSYEIAHYVGFTHQQEYDLLGLFREVQRLEYIRRHLTAIVPIITELEDMKERIQRNGHFRNLSL